MAGNGKRYTEEQIISILREAETAPTVAEVIRRHGVSARVRAGRGRRPRRSHL